MGAIMHFRQEENCTAIDARRNNSADHDNIGNTRVIVSGQSRLLPRRRHNSVRITDGESSDQGSFCGKFV